MADVDHRAVINDFFEFVTDKAYPCVAARTAMAHNNVPCLVASDMRCPHDDEHVLSFLYEFIEHFRTVNTLFHSAAVIFTDPRDMTEETFEGLLWQRLQSLSSLDAQKFPYDKRVSADPSAPHFSFSLGEEAFFIIGLNPASGRQARRFKYPTLIFNPHSQFERLRVNGQYNKMKAIVRRRDIEYSGSINPMLTDFGENSEAIQYSGRQYGEEWSCPLKIFHGKPQDHPSEK